ncbi:protein PROCA1 [Podarcis muralis]
MPGTSLPLLLLLLAGAGSDPARPPAALCVLRSPLAAGVLRLEASDGKELLSANWAPRRRAGLSGCSVSAEPREVAAFLGRCSAGAQEAEEPDFPGMEEAKAACLDGADGREASSRRRTKRGFTYPGTLWCGAGNIAESYEELGAHQETDRCCREHDHCQHVIHPFTYKYGYRNFRWHTISHCDCDNRLKACLRAVNDTASRVVGQAFFNVIQVPCFEFAYKEQCVEPYLYVWCKNYTTVAVAVAQDPVLYEYGGGLIDGLATHQPPPAKSSTTTTSFRLSAGSSPLPHKPDPAVVAAAGTTPAPQARPSDTPRKQRKGKGKGRKGRRGKGLKKKKAEAKAVTIPHPAREDPAAFPKQLVEQEPAKVDFQDPVGRPDLGEEDLFNAILGDDPAGLAEPGGREPTALPKATPRPPTVQPPPRKRKGRRRRLRERDGRSQHLPHPDLGGKISAVQAA